MESKAARIVRYTVLAVFLCLFWGGALLMGVWMAAALWHGGPNPAFVSTFPAFSLAFGFAGWHAWKGFRRGRWFDLLSVAVFLALLSWYLLMSAAILAGLWALAIAGIVLARQERRRRLSAAG